jgi:peptide-methionine (S)-S-oxide reductase
MIPYQKILDVFWHTYDPTTLNRQGNDVGTQYRSAVFFHDQKQKEILKKRVFTKMLL